MAAPTRRCLPMLSVYRRHGLTTASTSSIPLLRERCFFGGSPLKTTQSPWVLEPAHLATDKSLLLVDSLPTFQTSRAERKSTWRRSLQAREESRYRRPVEAIPTGAGKLVSCFS